MTEGTGNIKVSTGSMREKADAIMKLSDTMYAKLGDIKLVINKLEGAGMQSEAGAEIKKHINNMQGKFDDYKAVVNSYAQHLKDAADEYDAANATTKSNADQFATT